MSVKLSITTDDNDHCFAMSFEGIPEDLAVLYASAMTKGLREAGVSAVATKTTSTSEDIPVWAPPIEEST